MESGGVGRRPPLEPRAGRGGGPPPHVGRGGRGSGGAGGLSRGTDGRFRLASQGLDTSMVEHPAADEKLDAFGEEDEVCCDEIQASSLVAKQASGSAKVSNADCVDVPILEHELLQGISPPSAIFECDKIISTEAVDSIFHAAGNIMVGGNDDCFNVHMAGNVKEFFPSIPPKFCFGSSSPQKQLQADPVASSSCPLGVRGNAPSIFNHHLSDGYVAEEPRIPPSNINNAWHRPKVVPMPSVADLGIFSQDGSTVLLDNEEVAATLKKFDAALVGRLFGRRLPYPKLAGELKLRWAAFGEFKIVTMSSDSFICFFNSVEVRDAVLLGGPWVVLGQVLGIDRWSPAFSPSSSIGFYTPVWIRLPGLPLYCWSAKNIGRIVAPLGKPLWLDSATDQLERGLYARTCVRLDLSKPLRSGVWVDGCYGRFFQTIEYEGLSIFCCRCGQVGHKENSCKIMPAKVEIRPPSSAAHIGVPKQVGILDGETVLPHASSSSPTPSVPMHDDLQPPVGTGVVDSPSDLEGERGVGPWMMASKKKRQNKKSAAHHPSAPTPARIFTDSVPSPRGRSRDWMVAVPPTVHNTKSSPTRALGRSSKIPLPHGGAATTQVLDSHFPLEFGEAESSMHDGLPLVLSAAPNSGKDRPSKPFKMKMLNDLGPIALGARKKRKQHIQLDGGDASPHRPP